MDINEFRPVLGGCYTEKFGTHQCMLAARENVLRQFGKTLNDATIERVLRGGAMRILPQSTWRRSAKPLLRMWMVFSADCGSMNMTRS